ncbi:hypothetical protein AAES_132312 [Amazona aestiva]|uniref:Uncharacterized protein n=1 Tax=Amazona aestiva TaxID=12930 RepID=A0A0Q3M2K3_AMAAE|nr:hypothetical protein AAES_132312 [Amazona aestiva]
MLPQASAMLPQASAMMPQASPMLPQVSAMMLKRQDGLCPQGWRASSFPYHCVCVVVPAGDYAERKNMTYTEQQLPVSQFNGKTNSYLARSWHVSYGLNHDKMPFHVGNAIESAMSNNPHHVHRNQYYNQAAELMKSAFL